MLLKLGNKVGTSNIKESARRHRKQIKRQMFEPGADDKHDQGTDACRQCRGKVQEQSLPDIQSSVNQYPKITDLLRDLMEHDGECRRYPDGDAGLVTGRDDHSVQQVMERVPYQVESSQGVDMLFGSGNVAMLPA